MDDYFAGDIAAIDRIAVDTGGTPFQQSVWRLLRLIPPGTTATYGELAAKLNSPGAARAVGLANGSNPVAIVVPCHRVIGAGGKLVGYGGGLDRKRWLLSHESATAPAVTYRWPCSSLPNPTVSASWIWRRNGPPRALPPQRRLANCWRSTLILAPRITRWARPPPRTEISKRRNAASGRASICSPSAACITPDWRRCIARIRGHEPAADIFFTMALWAVALRVEVPDEFAKAMQADPEATGFDYDDPDTYREMAESQEPLLKPDAVPEELRQRMRPYWLLNRLAAATINGLSPEVLRDIRGESPACVPVLHAALRAWARDPIDTHPEALQRILALLGELAGPDILPDLWELSNLRDNGIFLHAHWAICRMAVRYPAETIQSIQATDPRCLDGSAMRHGGASWPDAGRSRCARHDPCADEGFCPAGYRK